jgi:1,4-dihydroxy-6-naphthoate synthase
VSAGSRHALRRPLRLGISPCPNDTFAFHGILSGRVDPGFELEIVLADVQELNERIARAELDASKASIFAALRLSSEVDLLAAGAALGSGVGPILVAAPGRPRPAHPRVLCPGEVTTAHLLYRLFHPGEGKVEQTLFSRILPAVASGEADLGVCIHEGRFVYRALGLELVEDLGATWEQVSGHLLPLGGIVARREMGRERQRALGAAVRASIAYARAHREETLPTLRAHAAEQGDDVLWAHVDLYVNAETVELSSRGRAAIAELERRARVAGWLPPGSPPLEIVDP